MVILDRMTIARVHGPDAEVSNMLTITLQQIRETDALVKQGLIEKDWIAPIAEERFKRGRPTSSARAPVGFFADAYRRATGKDPTFWVVEDGGSDASAFCELLRTILDAHPGRARWIPSDDLIRKELRRLRKDRAA